jgi:aminoglycoside 6-adenylyltransferase
MNADDFLDNVVDWASSRPDIVSLIMTGSRARPDGPVDEHSDYDLEIFTNDPSRYTSSEGWMSEIGKVWVYLPEEMPGRCETRLILFEGGVKVDFAILPVSALEKVVKTQKLDELYERGYRPLVDKTGLASRLPPPSCLPPARRAPTEAAFQANIREFWFEASHVPKFLQRGDLWVVKFRDWTMKELLLQMLEWHAISTREGQYIRHIGMGMKEWVRPDIWQRLDQVFGQFDATESWRALLASISLFRDVAAETASELGYTYPADVDQSISSYIRRFEGSSFAV